MVAMVEVSGEGGRGDAITVTAGFGVSTKRTSLELQQEALHPNAEMDTARQNSSIFKTNFKASKPLVIG